MASLDAFLAGDRPDHVAVFVADGAVDDADALAEHGTRVDDGVVLVVEGERGRRIFRKASGMDAMQFASIAMGSPGSVAPDLSDGDCPDADEGDHDLQFVFAFSEEQNDEAGGIYAEGDVIHAYAACSCTEAYSDRWVVGER